MILARLLPALFLLASFDVATAKPIIVMERSVIRESAKRRAPDIIPAVHAEGREYQLDSRHEPDGMEVSLLGLMADGRTTQWRTVLYRVSFDSAEETDVQEVYPKTLTLAGTTLQVTDERGGSYTVDAQSGQLQQPSEPRRYSQ